MIIRDLKGLELEKEKPNTSEDFFNRSSLLYSDNGEEKEFHVLYVRYFDEKVSEISSFSTDPIFSVNGEDIYFKDIVALVCLLDDPVNKQKKRLYINDIKIMKSKFDKIDAEILKKIVEEIKTNGQFLVTSSN